jgi:peroxiredoxin
MRLSHCVTICLLLAGAVLTTPRPATAIVGKGSPAPLFSLATVNGPKIDLAAMRGQVIVIDFFASWCTPCRDAIPSLNDLQQRLGGKGMQVIGLSADDDDAQRAVKEFTVANHITYPVAMAPEDLRDDYGLRSIPVLYVIDKKGNIAEIFRGLGSDTKKRMEELIRKLIAD